MLTEIVKTAIERPISDLDHRSQLENNSNDTQKDDEVNVIILSNSKNREISIKNMKHSLNDSNT